MLSRVFMCQIMQLGDFPGIFDSILWPFGMCVFNCTPLVNILTVSQPNQLFCNTQCQLLSMRIWLTSSLHQSDIRGKSWGQIRVHSICYHYTRWTITSDHRNDSHGRYHLLTRQINFYVDISFNQYIKASMYFNLTYKNDHAVCNIRLKGETKYIYIKKYNI